ncbi:hypothetical protein N9L92_02535 [Saprospiraceae bacterium]|nr:hypothetical protein [Saprospiraceae bacterium]
MKKPKKKLKLIHSKKNDSNNKIKKLEKELKSIIEQIEKNLSRKQQPKNNPNDTTKLSYK